MKQDYIKFTSYLFLSLLIVMLIGSSWGYAAGLSNIENHVIMFDGKGN